MNRQVRRLGIAMLVLFGALFVQLNVVHVLRADEYNRNPANLRAVTRDYGRPRGQIVSADGAVLARSVPDDSPFERRREYPEGALFGHITGSFSFTFGSDGVERSYNDELAGRTAAGSVRNLLDLLTDEEHTNDVVLTLHRQVQQEARDALGDRAGSVVALDPRDGSVLAMWSFPSYDPTPISQTDQAAAREARGLLLLDEQNPLRARSYRETFFPGSTFKVVTGTAGLASGKVTATEPRYPTESQFVPPTTNRPIRNFGGGTCGGDLIAITRVSCNTAFARMALDIGAEQLVGQAEAFGFNERPPIDLPGAAESTIAETDFFEQNLPLLAQTAIGQNTVRATPLQMALVAAGIANQGVVMTPHVLKEVRDDEGAVVKRYRADAWRTATTPEHAATMRAAMEAVVADGSGRRLAVPGIRTAGKTGTAQIGNGRTHTWIIGFAPADAPRVAIAVIVESQSVANEFTGGRIAAPIAQRVLQAALQAVPE